MFVAVICFIWRLQIPEPLLPKPTFGCTKQVLRLGILSSENTDLKKKQQKNKAKPKTNSQLLLIFTSFQQLVPWQMKCQNISRLKPYSSHSPTPSAGQTSLACTQHTLGETKNSQMAINRNSEEGNGMGSSRVSFLNGFQMEFSASSGLSNKGFSLKLHGKGRMQKSKFERFKMVAGVETTAPRPNQQ